MGGYLVAVVALCLPALLLLECGHCQWHRYIYLWQYCRGKEEALNWPDGFTGTWTSWFLGGGRRETSFRNGIPHGKDEYWYGEGQERFVQEIRNGVKEGPALFWYPNGRLRHSRWYEGGELNGPSIFWHENGRLKEISWRRHWKLHGRQRLWDPDGKLKADGVWRDGSPWEGTFADWTDDDSVVKRFTGGVEAKER